MKTVRLSEDLKRTIRRNAEEKFDKANPKKEYPKDGEAVFTRLGFQDKINATFKHFKDTWGYDCPSKDVTTLVIQSVYTVEEDDGEGNMQEREIDRQFEMDLPSTSAPAMMVDWHTMKVQVKPDDPTFVACMDTYSFNDNRGTRKRAEDRKLREVLEEFTTLNQLMKAASWLQPLIPADRLQKMHEKDDRSARVAQQTELAEGELSSLRETILEDSLLGDMDSE